MRLFSCPDAGGLGTIEEITRTIPSYFFGGFVSNDEPPELVHLMLVPKKIATTATTATAQMHATVAN
jgi:hypothetical protein